MVLFIPLRTQTVGFHHTDLLRTSVKSQRGTSVAFTAAETVNMEHRNAFNDSNYVDGTESLQ